MVCSLAGYETLYEQIDGMLGPRDRTRPDFYRARKYSKAHKVKEAATLITYAIKDLRKAEEAFFPTAFLVHLGFLHLQFRSFGVITCTR
jgi:hypothetical protein